MKKGKTQDQRHKEIDSALEQLANIGLSREMEDVAKFLDIAEDFHASGDIAVKGTKRRIVYKLSMQPHIASSIMLKHDEHV